MASRTNVILICDNCDSDSEVATHTVKLDVHEVEAEVCTTCWADLTASMANIFEYGRPLARRSTRSRSSATATVTPVKRAKKPATSTKGSTGTSKKRARAS